MRINSLTTRFLLALLLSTVVPFLLFGWYVHGEVRDREEQQVLSVYLPRWAADAARKIARKLEDAKNVGWFMVKTAEFRLGKNKVEEFEELVLSLSRINSDIDLVILANSRGNVQSVTWNPRLDGEGLAMLVPKEVGQFEWFQEVHKPTTEFWENRHLSPFLHRDPYRRLLDPTKFSLGLALPVLMEDGKYGALYILLSWREVQAVLDDTAAFLRTNAKFAEAKVFLADPDGVVLAHSDRGNYGKRLAPEELRKGVLGADEGYLTYASAPGEIQGVGFAAVQPYLQGGFDWRIGVHAPASQLFEVSREFGRWLSLIIPSIALVLAAFALVSSRAIIRPVRRLSEATRKLAQGDLDARVEPRGGDELSDLGRAFNTMAADLAESQNQLADAERKAAWAEMARQIAHEIKNPLTPMRMAAQMYLRARREDDPRQHELAERLARNVIQETDALDRIASDFRQFAGSPARDVRYEEADSVLAGVQELVSSMTETTDVDLEFVFGAEDARIAVDVQEMRRVFLNLIHNALEACGEQGHVCVASRRIGDRIEFRVEDDGPGIPGEVRARLFDPYFTTKTAGTGLGLAICHKIVEAHGGDIELEKSGPRQTVFLLTVPVAQQGAQNRERR